MSTEVEVRELPDAPAACPPAEASERPVTIVRPLDGWQLIDLRELWRFRDLLYFLAWRDVKVRYKQTVLGAGWAILQPVLMMVVFTIFFGRLAGVSSGGLAYPVFAYAGLLPWTFFATAVAAAGNSVVGSERLITKVYFPRLAIPFATVGAAIVDFIIASGLLLVLMLAYGVPFGLSLLWTPLVFGVIVLAAAGTGTLLAALNVAYRDFRYVIPFLLQVWMFATPTVYMQPAAEAGEGAGIVQTLLALNPMTGLVAAFRAAAFGLPLPWGQLAISATVAVAAFLLGCLYFRKVEDTFADVI
jgi:lipopolysaccharide transport system permease protein